MIALTRNRNLLLGLTLASAVLAAVAGMVAWTRPVREAVGAYTQLLEAANHQDVAAADRLCTKAYRASHRLRAADEGGLVGLPRNIHKNFQAWRSGPNVWLCPTNRIGPVYQFIWEDGSWKFDGPIGLLQPGGQVVITDPIDDASLKPD